MIAASPEDDREYSRLVRRGTWLAAGSGLAGAACIAGVMLGGLPSDAFGSALLLGGAAGATGAMAGLWPRLVPRQGGFSIGRAPLAGLLAGLAGHAGAWLAFYIAVVLIAEPASVRDLARAFNLTVVMSGVSVVLIGYVTLPVGIVAATSIALWCRWRAGRPTPA